MFLNYHLNKSIKKNNYILKIIKTKRRIMIRNIGANLNIVKKEKRKLNVIFVKKL